MSGSSKNVRPVKQLRGLQKLRYFCQMCEKQCRDENGFQNHIHSEKHIRQMQIFLEDPDKQLEEFSKEFEDNYLGYLRRRGDNPVNANNLYQEMISDKTHIHMTATKWDSLTTFVRYLADTGKAEVTVEDGKFFVKYINRDAGFLKRQEIVEKQRLATQASQQFTDKALEEQVIKAHEEAKLNQTKTSHELVPDDVDVASRSNRISLSLSTSSVPPTSSSSAPSIKMPPGIKGKSTTTAPPPGIVISKASHNPGLKTNVFTNQAAKIKDVKMNVFAKPQNGASSSSTTLTTTNVFGNKSHQDEKKGEGAEVEGYAIGAVDTAQQKNSTHGDGGDVTELKLGQKRPNPMIVSSDSKFTWIRKGLIVCWKGGVGGEKESHTDGNVEEKFIVSSLHGERKDDDSATHNANNINANTNTSYQEVSTLQDATFAKLQRCPYQNETDGQSSSKGTPTTITMIDTSRECEFTTFIPNEVDADVCLVRWKNSAQSLSSSHLSLIDETEQQRQLRTKLTLAMKACANYIDSRDLPKAKLVSKATKTAMTGGVVSSKDESIRMMEAITIKFPTNGIELQVDPNDVCAFVE